MIRPTCIAGRAFIRISGIALLAGVGLGAIGCKTAAVTPATPPPKYHVLAADSKMPAYLKGTIKDLVVVNNTGDFPVTSYGLVSGLRGSGDSTAPTIVRDWMVKEMSRHGLGRESFGYGHVSPEQMLSDPRVAIVGVVGNIPPGARRGDRIDIGVQAMPGNNTTSLANGMLWRASLRINGMADPVGAVNEYAKAQGNIFVNPAYAVNGSAGTPGSSLASLRAGTIPNGGIVTTDRAIHLVLRNPSWATSQALEQRLDQAFQSIGDVPKKSRIGASGVAEAQDEGYLHLYVPKSYHGDWEHFTGVATHLFLNANPGFLTLKAQQLAEEAVKPNAALMDISYCWEGIGPSAVPFITPLLSHPQQDVQFAAARAAAFLGDRYGEEALLQIARTSGHEYQVNAVQALGQLQNSALINSGVAELLNSDQPLVRIEAYKVLAAHDDPRVFSKVIHSATTPENEFVLDMVNSSGPPLIYCTRIGQPRVAVFGRKVSLQTPIVFSAFDSRFTISSPEGGAAATQLVKPQQVLNLFYREPGRRNPVEAVSRPDVAELVARLGGATDEGFHFTYGDIVAILQSLADKKYMQVTFMLQPLPNGVQEMRDMPSITGEGGGRPQGDVAPSNAAQVGASLPDLEPLPPTPKPNGTPVQDAPKASGPGANSRQQ